MQMVGLMMFVFVIARHVHPQYVPGPVGLATQAAGVGETIDVGFHVLFQFALVVCTFAANLAHPHSFAFNKIIFDLFIKLSIHLNNLFLQDNVWFILSNNQTFLISILHVRSVVLLLLVMIVLQFDLCVLIVR